MKFINYSNLPSDLFKTYAKILTKLSEKKADEYLINVQRNCITNDTLLFTYRNCLIYSYLGNPGIFKWVVDEDIAIMGILKPGEGFASTIEEVLHQIDDHLISSFA